MSTMLPRGSAPDPGPFLARPRKTAQRGAPRGDHFMLRSVGLRGTMELVRQELSDTDSGLRTAMAPDPSSSVAELRSPKGSDG